jgi:hypothetical protein
MALMAKDNGEGFDRELPGGGLQDAVCSKIFDLGKHQNRFNGNLQHKILVVWELAETMKSGKFVGERFVQHKEYTLSLNEKATLRKDLEGWMCKSIPEDKARDGIDLEKFIGMQCTLTIQHETSKSGNEYAKVAAVAPVTKHAPMLEAKLPADWCPDWIKQKMDEGASSLDSTPGEMGAEKEEIPVF